MELVRSVVATALLGACLTAPSFGSQRPSNADLAAGWTALQERRFDDALEFFTAAAESNSSDSSILTAAGFAALMLGQDSEAQAWLERALRLAPQDADASILLGELHHRAGRLAEAVATYEAALAYSPNQQTLREKLEQWRMDVTVREKAYESRGAHFSVLFQGPTDEMVARRAVEILEEAYWRTGSTLGTYPAGALTVVLYTDQQFRDITRSPTWAAGSYDGTIRVPARGALERPDELERVLAHEFVHAVVATIGGSRVPAWLNEGLASMLEPGGDRDETWLENEARLSLTDLEKGFSELPADRVRQAYAQSAFAVRKVVQLRGTSTIVTLLADLRRGVPFRNAFFQRVSMRYEDFQTMVERQ